MAWILRRAFVKEAKPRLRARPTVCMQRTEPVAASARSYELFGSRKILSAYTFRPGDSRPPAHHVLLLLTVWTGCVSNEKKCTENKSRVTRLRRIDLFYSGHPAQTITTTPLDFFKRESRGEDANTGEPGLSLPCHLPRGGGRTTRHARHHERQSLSKTPCWRPDRNTTASVHPLK